MLLPVSERTAARLYGHLPRTLTDLEGGIASAYSLEPTKGVGCHLHRTKRLYC